MVTCTVSNYSFHFITAINFYNAYNLWAACAGLFRRSELDFCYDIRMINHGVYINYLGEIACGISLLCTHVNPVMDVLQYEIEVFV